MLLDTMGIVDRLRDVFVSDSGAGGRYECAACEKVYDEYHENCLHCGSTEIEEKEEFGTR